MVYKNAQSLIKQANLAFNTSERSSFKELWSSALQMCRPSSEDVFEGGTAGEKKRVDRYIDIGVQALNTFTAGMTSTLIPKGSKFFEFSPSKSPMFKANDELQRWLADCSKITLDILNESNFYLEMSKAIDDLGVIGTSLVISEPCKNDGVRYKTFYITKYAFEEDAQGRVNVVYFKINLTARQIAQKFGKNVLTDKMIESMDLDTKFTIIHVIQPREDYEKKSLNPTKQKYASIYIDEETGELLKESGFSEMPAAVCRWFQASNEIYGRSPAMNSQGDLAQTNAMEYTKLRSAQRLASPQWLLPDDGSVRNLNNQAGGVILYNSTNPNGMPTQIAPKDMPNITHEYQQQKYDDIRMSFHVDVFNPMSDVTGNTTATEVDARMNIARQNLVPKISRVIDELLEPTLKRTFKILLDSGYYPAPPEEIDVKNIRINIMSTSGLILKQTEAVGALQLIESIAMLAQLKPEMLDYINGDELIKLVGYANAVPTQVLNSDYTVGQIRQQRADAQQAEQQQIQAVEAAKAYQATTKAAEEGSPAQLLTQFAG